MEMENDDASRMRGSSRMLTMRRWRREEKGVIIIVRVS